MGRVLDGDGEGVENPAQRRNLNMPSLAGTVLEAPR